MPASISTHQPECLIVTRHDGAAQWIQARLGRPCVRLGHLRVEEVTSGKRYYGVFPLHLAAAICAQGSECWSLKVDVPLVSRGLELSADDLDQMSAELVRYFVDFGAVLSHGDRASIPAEHRRQRG